MRCFSCSVELQEDALVCHKCGASAKQEIECACGELLDPEDVICPGCGEEV